MNREVAIQTIIHNINDDDLIVSTTGLISREIFEKYDRPGNFYMTGSMGAASSIGLGIALNTKKRVIVIDGDSALLMNLGSMATLGNQKPHNLLHIILDNGSYASCSEEKSFSKDIDLCKIATEVGYGKVVDVKTVNEFIYAIKNTTGKLGFIRVPIKLGGRRDFSRPLDLAFIKNRFQNFVRGD